MLRQPRDPKKPLFSRRNVALSFLQGFVVLVIVLAVYAFSLYRGQGEAEARALTFTTLIVANLGLILTNRSWSRTILETLKSSQPCSLVGSGRCARIPGCGALYSILKRIVRLCLPAFPRHRHLLHGRNCEHLWFEGQKFFYGRRYKS